MAYLTLIDYFILDLKGFSTEEPLKGSIDRLSAVEKKRIINNLMLFS